ncbi:MAG: choice-of-anchor N protein [candidate division Zixibacteria bacterium]|nr:choice-of-anchor N protein [candidate division Zixibacteria bacterium]
MKIKFLTALLTLAVSTSAFAVPGLQLYSPDATWDALTETWVTDQSEFELWVVCANLNKGQLTNVTLVASLASGDVAINGGLEITNSAAVTTTKNAGDWLFGTPAALSPHGIFPTLYTTYLAAATTSSPYVSVLDYNGDPGGGGSNAFGNVFKFTIKSGYASVHFDAFATNSAGKSIFAPYSHDAQSTPGDQVPEPASMLLFGLGLAGAGIVRRMKNSK